MQSGQGGEDRGEDGGRDEAGAREDEDDWEDEQEDEKEHKGEAGNDTHGRRRPSYRAAAGRRACACSAG